MLIPEGSWVIIQDDSFNTKHSPVKTSSDIEVFKDQIIMFNGYLCCTKSYDPVEKLENGLYQINVWALEALVIRDGCMYGSVQDAE